MCFTGRHGSHSTWSENTIFRLWLTNRPPNGLVVIGTSNSNELEQVAGHLEDFRIHSKRLTLRCSVFLDFINGCFGVDAPSASLRSSRLDRDPVDKGRGPWE